LELDVLIFGGGVAGLWLLDELHRRRFRVLLIERRALGAGQSIASQGILHGGLKYMLGGMASGSARTVGAMTDVWRACLSGRGQPDLSDARIFSPCCYLWRTDSLISRAALSAARLVLRTSVERVATRDRPAALVNCPGEILRVNEQVVDVASFLSVLARGHTARIMQVGEEDSVDFVTSSLGRVDEVQLRRSAANAVVSMKTATTVFAAGEGNEDLRRRVGLSADTMQLRPLRMVMVRGRLPQLFGHCVDGNKTRVTITSAVDSQDRTVWQLGGEIAEKGVDMTPSDLIQFAQRELMSVLPGVDWAGVEWATYRINRAEGRSTAGLRPDGPVWRRDGSVISAWPTKLVLAPRLARSIADALGDPPEGGTESVEAPPDWPRPEVAQPPWEVNDQWRR
jgi:glycine/D-amino acid oxidase-like deaminating enzyme